MNQQHRLLTEVIVPESITPNLLTDYDIYNDSVVVDGYFTVRTEERDLKLNKITKMLKLRFG